VDVSDINGGYLITRLKKVNELLDRIPNSYWINQYGNPLNARAYYLTLGEEMCRDVKKIDYVFLGVSSCGTITGVSQKIKERFPDATIVAVDIKGSVIFGGEPQKRYIPGIGSSKVPEILKEAVIDDVMVVTEEDSIESCHELLNKYNVFVGGSSGSVITAIKQYFKNRELKNNINIVTIFADKGERYQNTIYCREWIYKNFNKELNFRVNIE
jgi:cysteine synthase